MKTVYCIAGTACAAQSALYAWSEFTNRKPGEEINAIGVATAGISAVAAFLLIRAAIRK